jgi:hypothetical protein
MGLDEMESNKLIIIALEPSVLTNSKSIIHSIMKRNCLL